MKLMAMTLLIWVPSSANDIHRPFWQELGGRPVASRYFHKPVEAGGLHGWFSPFIGIDAECYELLDLLR
jgi:hypothetical protein